jgi:hypothetical protein
LYEITRSKIDVAKGGFVTTEQVLAFVGFGLQFIGLGLWAGGLVYYLAIASPLAFRELGNRVLAADYLAVCLRRFHTVEAISALLSLCGAGFLYVAPVVSPLLWVDIGTVVLMFLVFVAYAGFIMPRLDNARIELHEAESYTRDTQPATFQSFLTLHAWYHRLVLVNVAAAIVLLLVLSGLAMQCSRPATAVNEADASMFGGTFGQWP